MSSAFTMAFTMDARAFHHAVICGLTLWNPVE